MILLLTSFASLSITLNVRHLICIIAVEPISYFHGFNLTDHMHAGLQSSLAGGTLRVTAYNGIHSFKGF